MFLEQSKTIQPHGATMDGPAATCREGGGQSGDGHSVETSRGTGDAGPGDGRWAMGVDGFVCFPQRKNPVVR